STGTPVPRYMRSARSIVPSPPRTTTSSASAGSPCASRPCCAASSAVTISSTPIRRASETSRSTPSPTCSGRPCVTSAARATGRRSADGGVDSALELIGVGRLLARDQVDDELPVPLRSRVARVYEPRHASAPALGRRAELAQDACVYCGVADDAAGGLCAPGLELRLDEHERDPVRYRQPEGRWQHEGCGDERHVAGDELRRERERLQPARVDPLEHDHPLVPAEPRVQLPVADVERDHPSGAALQETIGETARGRTEIEAVLARRIDAERVERVRELLAAARDELRRAPHLELDVFRDLLAGLGESG